MGTVSIAASAQAWVAREGALGGLQWTSPHDRPRQPLPRADGLPESAARAPGRRSARTEARTRRKPARRDGSITLAESQETMFRAQVAPTFRPTTASRVRCCWDSSCGSERETPGPNPLLGRALQGASRRSGFGNRASPSRAASIRGRSSGSASRQATSTCSYDSRASSNSLSSWWILADS